MTIPEVLEALDTYTGKYPFEAVAEAVREREAITPELLKALQAAADDPATAVEEEVGSLPLYATFLLAQFREKRAYRQLVKLAGATEEQLDYLIGGTLTESFDRVLASVYDGDLGPLQGLIEREGVYEFVKSAALRTLFVLFRNGAISRETLVGYFRELYEGRLPRHPDFAWNELCIVTAQIPAPELLEEMRKAYADELAHPGVAGLEELEKEMSGQMKPFPVKATYIEDAAKEMSWWACFNPEPSRPRYFDPPLFAPQPLRVTKIGRNEPCTCGSGKKYKKCCGA